MPKTKEEHAARMRERRRENPEAAREYQRNWCAANPDKVKKYQRQRREKHGERDRMVVQLWYQAHKKERAVYTRQRRQEKKVEVLTHYGGGVLACVYCGERRLACLSIDHINGGGTKHRNSLPDGGRLYLHLIKWGFPEGYQTLCMNCQFVKRDEEMEYGNSYGSVKISAKDDSMAAIRN